MNLDMAVFQQIFFDEAADLLETFEDHLLRLESAPVDPELLNTIFRCAHSIKGGSATFGLQDIAHFTHGLETLLDLVRNGKVQVDASILQLLLASLDHLKDLLASARGESDSAPNSDTLSFQIEEAIANTGHVEESWNEAELREEIAQMLAAAEAEPATSKQSLPQPATVYKHEYKLLFTPGPDVLRQGANLIVLFTRLHEAGEVIDKRCDTSKLPSLESLDPETSYLSWTVNFRSNWERERVLDIFEFVLDSGETILSEMPDAGFTLEYPADTSDDGPCAVDSPSEFMHDAHDAILQSPPIPDTDPVGASTPGPPIQPHPLRSRATDKTDAQTLRVSTDKVDKLIDLVGELVISQSMLNEVIQDFSMAKLSRLREAVAEMERASRELQERVMAVRMLPIKTAFGRFPRLVHDLSVACGKKVELKTTGEETELDKSVIEGIADPITHLVRNSVDHGIETPEERRAAGKLETGVVSLHAFQEGGGIIIEVSDDGRGLNRERILAKAYERGLLSESEPVPSDETLYNFIFDPGFSTAATVTDVSGRGVGMDIVRQSVQVLGGTISIGSIPGKGTRFRIRLPLTMAILEGLSISVGEEVYILPLTSIVESIRPRPDDIRHIAGRVEVVMVRGETLPVLRLYQVFGAVPRFTDPARGLLVIVENDGRKVALLVDELIGQNQAVIKSLETNYHKVQGIAGATIRGDGRVALILDVPGLIKEACGRQNSLAA